MFTTRYEALGAWVDSVRGWIWEEALWGESGGARACEQTCNEVEKAIFGLLSVAAGEFSTQRPQAEKEGDPMPNA